MFHRNRKKAEVSVRRTNVGGVFMFFFFFNGQSRVEILIFKGPVVCPLSFIHCGLGE